MIFFPFQHLNKSGDGSEGNGKRDREGDEGDFD